jgi:voltage-gated potassium channel
MVAMLGSIRKSKFFRLLLALLAFFLITPFVVDSEIDLYIFSLLFSIILCVSVYVVTHKRWVFILSVFLAALVFVGIWINSFVLDDLHFLEIEYGLIILFFSVITVVILRSVVRDRVITFNTLCGAICGYLMIGFVWSFFYSLIYTIYPTAFNLPEAKMVIFDSNFQRFIYYSYVTLTTLGYGDISPVLNIAKTLAWLEAIVGQVYLTIWIAQLVGLHITQHTKQDEVST